MKPIFRISKTTRFCHYCDKVLSGRVYKFFIKPFLFVIPLSLIATIMSNTDLLGKLQYW